MMIRELPIPGNFGAEKYAMTISSEGLKDPLDCRIRPLPVGVLKENRRVKIRKEIEDLIGGCGIVPVFLRRNTH